MSACPSTTPIGETKHDMVQTGYDIRVSARRSVTALA